VDELQLLLVVFFDRSRVETRHGENFDGGVRGIDEGIQAGGRGAVDVGQQEGGDTGIEGALDGLVAVGVEGFVVEVTVGVDELRMES
jgi:hypothetical protein